MSAQTSYQINTNKRIHGSLSDLQNSEVDTYAAEGGEIGLGVVVSKGTDPEQQAVLGGVAPVGITLRDLTREGKPVTAVLTYDETEEMSVLKAGRVNITLPAGGNPGDALKYNTTTGVIDVGAPGAGEAVLAGAQIRTVTVAGGVAEIRYELPHS